MASDLRTTELPMAQVALVDDNLIEVRIRKDVRIDVTGLLGSMQARREMLPGGSGCILFMALGDLDWETAALQTDFFGEDTDNITAVAVVVNSKVLTMVANTYFTLFPVRFPAKIFSEEIEARQWLSEQGA
ncbi:MAG TPA: STAS/SEC14 domain-containing protein [Flavobacteriales bacterium]|nr:STAS/SEC14 domain-containing protein [Flavobacteriales bacterium]